MNPFKEINPISDRDRDQEELYIPNDLAERLSQALSAREFQLSKSCSFEPAEKLSSEIKTLCVQNIPEWADENEIKTLLLSCSASGLESYLSTNQNRDVPESIINSVQLVRDPTTLKCLGYAYVEFKNHETAEEIMNLLQDKGLKFPRSNKILTFKWHTGMVNPSSVIDNYHFYIGNLKPNLSNNLVFRTIKALHSSVASIRLLPQEIIGTAPKFYLDEDISDDPDQLERSLAIDISNNFYFVKKKKKIPINMSYLDPQKTDLHEWGCGFLRLTDESKSNWKVILRELRVLFNSDACSCLRRFQDDLKFDVNETEISAYSSIIVRPIFGKLEDGSLQVVCTPNVINHSPEIPLNINTNSACKIGGITVSNEKNIALPEKKTFTKTTIFIGNLNQDIKESDLTSLFNTFGFILSIRITHLKHVAFIQFADARCALAALSHLSGCYFRKHNLQFDWGRSQAGSMVLQKPVDFKALNIHNNTLNEKKIALERAQAMKPYVQENNFEKMKTLNPSVGNQAQWLASLYFNLPKRPKTEDTQ